MIKYKLTATDQGPDMIIGEAETGEGIENESFFKFFRVGKEERKFMYLWQSTDKTELWPFIELIKQQGDMYRITKEKREYILWDARW